MPVTRISHSDSQETKDKKFQEIEKAKDELQATRDAIEREYGKATPVNRYR